MKIIIKVKMQVMNFSKTLKHECEIIWARIQQKGTKDLYICAYYNPKTSDVESLQRNKCMPIDRRGLQLARIELDK